MTSVRETARLGHKVTEHEDGTITACRSILIKILGIGVWYGFLKLGIWSECP